MQEINIHTWEGGHKFLQDAKCTRLPDNAKLSSPLKHTEYLEQKIISSNVWEKYALRLCLFKLDSLSVSTNICVKCTERCVLVSFRFSCSFCEALHCGHNQKSYMKARKPLYSLERSLLCTLTATPSVQGNYVYSPGLDFKFPFQIIVPNMNVWIGSRALTSS